MSLPPGPGRPPVPAVGLVILDGWGLAPPGPGNAVELADTPVFDELWDVYAHTTLTASGRAVGLPDGQMGNSEVGHLNLGAGAVVRQDLTRIDDAIADGSFARNDVLQAAYAAGRDAGRLHLMGLVSRGGVHSGWEHIRACIELASAENVPDLVVHAFTDGRDTLPDSGAGYIEEVEGWPYAVAFPPDRPAATLASVLADRGVEQLHVAETEKYAHVTYFFNGGEEEPYAGEERCLVDSPRDVPTYDKRPEMSARAAADEFARRWRDGRFGFGIINFANPDMVGHTGSIPAAVTAVEAVDACLGEVVEAVHESGAACLITADHGNADNMLEPDGSPNTVHSLNPVPLITTAAVDGLRERGILADVAPTVLNLLGQEQPPEMSGKTLISGR